MGGGISGNFGNTKGNSLDALSNLLTAVSLIPGLDTFSNLASHKDIVRLADILGHTSVNTTRIYTMETGDIHRKQIQELGLLKC